MITVKKFYSEKQAKSFVYRCDRNFDRRLSDAAEGILHKIDNTNHPVKIVALAGPSCAGKTTCAKKLSEVFEKSGRNAITVSIDDFYYERDVLLERAKGGKVDFDSPDTIDIETLEECVESIFEENRGEIKFPVYDFQTGKRSGYKIIPPDPERDDIFIIEGIQAFYPNVQEIFNQFGSVSVFINVIGKLKVGNSYVSGEQIRFLRRLVRDNARRNASPEYTYELWTGVRENEEKNIYPYALNAEYKIDSLVGYDLSMLRPYAEELLKNIPEKSDFRPVADEILDFLSNAGPVSKDYIAKNSLFHEFI